MFETAVAILQATRLDIPGTEPFLLITILMIAILLRWPRFGLLAAYMFAYRWCWYLLADFPVAAQLAYALLGIAAGALSVAGMLREPQNPSNTQTVS